MATTSRKGTLEPIPQPPTQGLDGNKADINPQARMDSLAHLAHLYGPLFKLDLPGRQTVFATNYAYANELCDEKRFIKKGDHALRMIRQAVLPESIFVVPTDEPIWSKAHAIMLPLFGPKAIESYMPKMWEETVQMLLKWENMNPDESIDVSRDMVRITSDVIARCCFDYHFNSFYRETPHPIIQALMRGVEEGLSGIAPPPLEQRSGQPQRLDALFLQHAIDDIIRRRIGEGVGEHNDMLDMLLAGYDKKTGTKFSGPELRDQVITLLFAGHITTSTLLAFALYELINHPEVLAKAYDEVDRVLGKEITRPPSAAQIGQLQYLSQILKETLRLYPPAQNFSVNTLKPEETLGERYRVTAHQDLTIVTPLLHRDRAVWGDDVEVFKPDRFLPDAEAQIPANAYKPFGNGQRACLGRAFALREAPLVLGMIMQYFDLIDYSGYQLQIQDALTPKPVDFTIQVKRRQHIPSIFPTRRASTVEAPSAPLPIQAPEPQAPVAPPSAAGIPAKAPNIPLAVLFGSNLGTSEGLANQIGDAARERGFITRVESLDNALGKVEVLPEELGVIIVVSSYNGNPPDNATKFCTWLQDAKLSPDALKGVHYAVFGCGNRQWASTYQAVPTFIDQALEKHGAHRMHPLGAGDANGDFDGMFQSWYQSLWSAAAREFSLPEEALPQAAPAGPQYHIDVAQGELTPSPYISSYGAIPCVVRVNDELQKQHGPEPRSTRRIEVGLTSEQQYQAGDHFGVLAYNGPDVVERVLRHFGCDDHTTIRVHKNDTRRTPLPVGQYVRLSSLLAAYLELREVATRSQIKRLIEHTHLTAEKEHLSSLVQGDPESEQRYTREVLGKHLSLLDLLESHPSCDLPLATYLELLSPLRPRYYSISSSPLVMPDTCRITVGVLEEPALSGNGIYRGTCSSFLKRRKPDETIYGFVQNIKSPFRLPEDHTQPMIMICAGTGLAPFMGFLQERSMIKQQGQQVGPSLLFFGCRNPEQDYIYRDELAAYEQQGIAEVLPAFSRQHSGQKMYVQDKVLEQQDKVWDFILQGASTFICGDLEKMVPAVARAYRVIYRQKQHATAEEAAHWLQEMTDSERYVVDIWGTSSAVFA